MVSIQAKTQHPAATKKTLRIGVTGDEPFVFMEQGKGIAKEIWNEIAENKSWNFKYVPFENVNDALHQLNMGGLF